MISIFISIMISSGAYAATPATKVAYPTESETIKAVTAHERAKRYDLALKLNIEYLNRNHSAEARKIIKAMRANESIVSSEYSKGVKDAFFRIYSDYAFKIIYDSEKNPNEADIQNFNQYKLALEKLEHQELAVEKLNDRVKAKLREFETIRYVWHTRIFIDYLSWQTAADLVGPFEVTALLSTNIGLCPGVGLSFENKKWSYSADLSLLYGSGGVSATQGLVNYQQSNVPAFGGKLALGAGMIVSETRAELGLRATLLYVKQSLDNAPQAGYVVNQPKAFGQVISIYSRWTLDPIYLQTDFGRYIGRPATLWSIGLGYQL